MKKIIMFLVLLLISTNVYAQNIFDNCELFIIAEDGYYNVREKCEVVELENEDDWLSQVVPYGLNIITNNFEESMIVNEDKTYLLFKAKEGNTYYFEYKLKMDSYSFNEVYAPENAIIKHLDFKIRQNQNYVLNFSGSSELWKIESNSENEIIGSLLQETDNLDFTFNITKKNMEDVMNDMYSFENVFAVNKMTYIAIGCLCITLLGLLIKFIRKEDFANLAKPIFTFSILCLLGSIIYDFVVILETPLLLGFFAFYLVFYAAALFLDNKDSFWFGVSILAFICFHSLFFWGLALGVFAHVINHINLILLMFIKRKYHK